MPHTSATTAEEECCAKLGKSTAGGYLAGSLIAFSLAFCFLPGGTLYAAAHHATFRADRERGLVDEKKKAAAIVLFVLGILTFISGVCLCVHVVKSGGFDSDDDERNQQGETRSPEGRGPRNIRVDNQSYGPVAGTEPPPSYEECVK